MKKLGFAVVLFGFAVLAYAQVVDNATRVWTGTQTFRAPVTFESTATTTMGAPVIAASGSVSTPSLAFQDDPDTGIYYSPVAIRFATGGTQRALVKNEGLATVGGSAITPGLTAIGDANTGVYWDNADGFGVSVGGNDWGIMKIAAGTLSAAQVLALNGTPIEVIAAPGAGLTILVESVQFHLDFNSAAYAGVDANEDLVLEYQTSNNNATDPCDASTNCLDPTATADYFAAMGMKDGGNSLYENDAIDITRNTGEWTTGDSPIHYLIRYRVIPIDLS